MKLTFAYDKERDIDCVLEYGKTSVNSLTQTKVYEELLARYGDNPSKEKTSQFADDYFEEKNIDINTCITTYQKHWDAIEDEYQKRAESIFGVALSDNITAYITINNRCPYNIDEHYFFVSVSGSPILKTAMHELWHFYTWYKYGVKWEAKLGRDKYNEIKEALTVLLNVECKDLLPEGVQDYGYMQHKELREKILKLWEDDKNMDRLWEKLVL